ncbi:MAG: BrnT family toxin [Silvibacterium sp.]
MFEWDEEKREANLKKHGLDFTDAYLVYEHPEKITLRSNRHDEVRRQDIAIVEVAGGMLSLAYTRRGENIRVISFRRASRTERRMYDTLKDN